MRTLAITLLALLAGALVPATASAHAVLVSMSPEAGSIVDAPPAEVRLVFNEQIQLLDRADADVRDENGNTALASLPLVDPNDVKVLKLDLRPDLEPGTYTVLWRVMGADTHVIPGRVVFGVGVDELGPPAGASFASGPSETGPWAVSARAIHLIALGGLLGLLAFRWLVWRDVWRSGREPRGVDRAGALEWGRDQFWVAFGVLAIVAMVTEGYLLVVKSAIATGRGVLSMLQDPAGINTVLSDTRFGDLVQLRGALLFLVFGLGTWQFLSEFGRSGDSRAATAAGRPVPAAIMAGLLLVILGGVAASGHATQAPLPWLQVGAQLAHVAALAVWLAGLVYVSATTYRLPRTVTRGGREIASRVLMRFSGVALVAVAVAIATGTLRAAFELSDPAQLWETTYGRLILLKVALLVPVGVLALRNRRIVNSLRRLARPSEAGLTMVRRASTVELALSLVIVVAAAVLSAEVPGRV